MSRRRRHCPTGHSYRELIDTVEESTSDLLEQQMKRDLDCFVYEKYKLVLLILIALSLWIMFALLWERFDDPRPVDVVPAFEHHLYPTGPDSFPQPHSEEPISIHYL